MADKCLRTMSCRCPLCAGEDISMLVNINKGISSNITYEEDGDEAAPPPPPPSTMGRLAHSPPLPAARKTPTMAQERPPPATQDSGSMEVEMTAPPAAPKPRVPRKPPARLSLAARMRAQSQKPAAAMGEGTDDAPMEVSKPNGGAARMAPPTAAARRMASSPAPMEVETEPPRQPVMAPAATPMADDKCLRNMNCKCRLCGGEDVSTLLNISRGISSKVSYDEGDQEMDGPPPPPAMNSRVTNSPPVPGVRAAMAATTTTQAPPQPRMQQQHAPPRAVSRPPLPQRAPVEVEMASPPPAPVAAPVARQTAPASASTQKCLRNMNCKCPLCGGEDVSTLLSISRGISSTVTYEDDDAEMEGPPPPPMGSRVTNSPPLPSVRKTPVMQTPTAAAPPVQAQHSIPAAVSNDSSMIVDQSGDTASGEIPAPDVICTQLREKNWQVRRTAYGHVRAMCERPGVRGDELATILEMFPKMCEDINASALEAAFQAVLAYTLHVEPFDKSVVPPVMKRVIDKGFSGRPGVIQTCEELVSAFMEAGAVEDTVNALIEGTKNRKPKVPPMCVSCILEGLKAFGPRVIPIPAVKAALPALCESTVNGVRPVALNVIVEIFRWTGPSLVQDIVGNLRQAQQTEFQTLTKDIILGQAQPTKWVRGAKKQTGSKPGASKGGSSVGPDSGSAGGFDPREFAETVNLLEKLPRTEFRTRLAAPKWSEKVAALKIVLDVIGPVPKLANGDYYELVNTLKLLCNDSNVNIVAKSIEVLGVLADGLRKSFTQYARLMYPEVMKKLSDKKSVVLNAVHNTLDAFIQYSMSLDLMLDEIRLSLDASKNKSPQARVQTLSFLSRWVDKRLVNLNDSGVVLDFGNMFMAGMDEVDPTVRKAAMESFVGLVKMTEDNPDFTRSMMNTISSKNPRGFKVIQKSLGQTGTSSAASSRPSSASSSRSIKGSTSPEVPDVDMSATPDKASKSQTQKPTRGPPSRLAGKSPIPTSAVPPASRKVGNVVTSAGGAGAEFVPCELSLGPDDAAQIVADLNIENWPSIVEGFASIKWTDRKDAIERLAEFVKVNPGVMNAQVIEAMSLFLSANVKTFKESNINVLKCAFEAIQVFAACDIVQFPRSIICHVVPNAVDKIGDRKASDAVRGMILQLCEATHPQYVIGCIVDHMGNVKAPLAHIGVLSVMQECINEFGVASCNPRMLIDHAKGPFGVESAVPKVRSTSIEVLAVMYSQLGPAMMPILNLESWKPALAATVDKEFKKIKFNPTVAASGPKRAFKDADQATDKGDTGALFGRVDISAQVTKDLLADMKCEDDKAAWKKRLAAMEKTQEICEGAGCAIELTKPVIELLKALKARLNDSNANLKIKAVQVIGVVVTSIGPDVAKLSKGLGPILLSGVSDNKKNMQLASIETLHKWVRHNNQTSVHCVESLLVPTSEQLANTVGRAELLGWALDHLQFCDRVNLSCLVAPTVQCMMDKSSEAREKAMHVLAYVMKSVGKDTILKDGCRDVKPAQMRALLPQIEKAHAIMMEIASKKSVSVTDEPADGGTTHRPSVHATTPQASAASEGSRLGRNPSMPPSRVNGTGSMRQQQARPGSSFRVEDDVGMDDVVPHNEASVANKFLKMNSGKRARLSKGQYNKWIFDPISQSEINSRKNEIELEWRPFLSTDFHAKLFAPTLEKGMLSAMSDLMVCITSQPQELLAALDLVFKWCSLRIVDNNVQALAKLLEVLVKIFDYLKSIGYYLDDVEASILLPYLLQESGQSKPRFRLRFRDIMRLVVDVYSTDSYVAYLMECVSTSKNMKSRCECIDIIEYIVKMHGVNAVGKKCVKDIGKFVSAHEKEIRESAINALIAVYLRTDGNVDRFFRFTGVTTQQGMDLLAAKIKYLPPTMIPDGSAFVQPSVSQPIQSSVDPRTPPRTQSAASTGPSPMSGLKHFNQAETTPSNSVEGAYPSDTPQYQPVDEDVEMATPGKDLTSDEAIEANLIQPIADLLTDAKEIVGESSLAFQEGVDGLKGLYTIIFEPADEAELNYLRFKVNEITVLLCDLIHASLGSGDPKKPISLVVLTLSLSSLHQLLQSAAIDHIQRFAVERILLEISAKLLDPRFESIVSMSPNELELMTAETRRFVYLHKALNAIMVTATKKIKAGELYPSVITLLQRIVRNDVGDYNKRDTFNHLMKSDSVDQLVGRLLIEISKTQAGALNPFEGIDIFGVLMQMHSFFSTLPRSDLFAVQIANNNMKQALQIIADSLMSARTASFEASVNDLPLTSPVRELLADAGHLPSSSFASNGVSQPRHGGPEASVSTGSSYVTATSSNSISHRVGGDDAPSITRRLFDAGESAPPPMPPTVNDHIGDPSINHHLSNRFGSSNYSGNNGFGEHSEFGERASFPSSSDYSYGAGRASTMSVNELADEDAERAALSSSATQTSNTTRGLRERLEKMRRNHGGGAPL